MSELIQQSINALLLGCNYTLIAIGFSLFFGALNVVHFSHGDVCILGSYVILIFYAVGRASGLLEVLPPGLSVPVLIGAAAAVTGILGAVFERLVIRPFRHAPLLMVLVATVALGLIIREAIRVFYPQGSNPQIFPQLLPGGGLHVAGIPLRYDNLIILGVTVGLIFSMFLFIERTRMGAAIRAISQDMEAAMMMGINIDTTVAVTFLLGSGLGAVAGILNGAYISIVRFDMGLMGGIKGFSAAVVGGLGNIYGAIFGGLVLGFVETFASAFIPGGTAYKDVFAFLVVIFFLVFKPSGILGEKAYEKV
ncbi:MAG: branched-chain amino acid ABC transporter permease [Deltaproteobacteria bacterium]|nr:branched-chain amino acid ABC transporter permease [Deltaproteobacteria bacterium]MBW2122831.1 branched-chain amino acid ABC transporter permease [Deltaproteobacteria bacterium]